MKIKNVKLEWYVLLCDFNSNEVINYNVIDSQLVEGLHREIAKKKSIKNYAELKEYIRKWALCRYWSRCEYEICVGRFPRSIEELEKVDAYRQIEMNLDRICEYIMKELKIEF